VTAGPAHGGDDASEWRDVGSVDDFPAGAPRLVRVGGRRLAVVRLPGPDATFRAVDDACPHAGDPLSLGVVFEGRLACRAHGWAFDLETGACVAGDRAARVVRHRAEARGERVFVRLETAP